MIVLNENDWAAEMIQARSLGKKPYETLCRVAKYYADKMCRSKREVRKMMDEFLLSCDPTASLPKWSDTIDHAVTRAFKYDAIEMDKIDITVPEIEIIKSLSGRQLQRLAITLLCLSKYWDYVNPHGDHWVNTKDSEIMRMANINTSIKRQCGLYHQLNELGLIQFSKKVNNTNVRVLFQTDGDVALSITDMRNIGNQYLMYNGEPYYTCENCGITVKRKNNSGRHPKYCPECANKVAIQNNINSVMRCRNNDPNRRIKSIWQGMIARCNNSNSASYKNYGGRGITVCDEWANSFESFLEWANHSGYSDNLSIDRIDNDGNYSPDNCRWATSKEQANNKRTNVTFEYNGKKMTMQQLSELFDIPYQKLYMAIKKNNGDVDSAVSMCNTGS